MDSTLHTILKELLEEVRGVREKMEILYNRHQLESLEGDAPNGLIRTLFTFAFQSVFMGFLAYEEMMKRWPEAVVAEVPVAEEAVAAKEPAGEDPPVKD